MSQITTANLTTVDFINYHAMIATNNILERPNVHSINDLRNIIPAILDPLIINILQNH